MKRYIPTFILLAFYSITLLAQNIEYEPSFDKAKRHSIQEKKPIAILITFEQAAYSPSFMDGLNDKQVIEKFNRNFINYKVSRTDTTDYTKIIKEYRVTRLPSFVFLDAKGGLILTDIAQLSHSKPLLAIADKAIAATKEKSLVDYDRAYSEGNRKPIFLKNYIIRREKAGIQNNASLIEDYTSELKVTDLQNYNEVLFILKAGPIIGGSAYKLAHLNSCVVDSIFRTEPLADRLAMNNAAIKNTMDSAIASRNEKMAFEVANFTRQSWSKNYTEGYKNWSKKMIQYYLGVNDTAKYLQQATMYYEQYYMRITVDSIRKIESSDLIAAQNNAEETITISDNGTHIKRTKTIIRKKDSSATDLNNAAWSFYKMARNKEEFLFKALLWSRRSIELSPNPTFYDTYAHLLYRLKFFNEAESAQKKAIELSIDNKTDTKLFQDEYNKIKARSL